MPPISERALSIGLKDLVAAGLISRQLIPSYPPGTAYRLEASGHRLARLAITLTRALAREAPPT